MQAGHFEIRIVMARPAIDEQAAAFQHTFLFDVGQPRQKRRLDCGWLHYCVSPPSPCYAAWQECSL